MNRHIFYLIYIVSIVIGFGMYIKPMKDNLASQKATITTQETTITTQEITIASQRETISDFITEKSRLSVAPVKEKIKIVEKPVEKIVNVPGNCTEQDNILEKQKKQLLQCAYELQYCRQASSIYSKMTEPQKEQEEKKDGQK